MKKIKWGLKFIIAVVSLLSLSQCAKACSAATAATLYTVRIGENVNGTVIEKQVNDIITIADGTIYAQTYDYNYSLVGYTLKSIVTTFDLIESGEGYYKYKVNADGYFNLIYDLTIYSITFLYYDSSGNVAIYNQILKYKDIPTAPSVPEMPYGAYLSWDSAITEVTGNKQYKAIYSYKTYTVNYVANGQVLKTMLVNHYDKTVLSYEPELEKYYSFEGWTTETGGKRISELNINSDLTLYALTTYDDRTLFEKASDWFGSMMVLVKIVVIFIVIVVVLFGILIFLGLWNNAFSRRK